jgi:NitT/TauT family transport system substrate-binding protein
MNLRHLVAALTVAMLAAACGPKPDSGSAGQDMLKVGIGSGVSNVSLYLAVQKGFFADGIEVEPYPVTSGSQAFPLLLNGQLGVTATDPLSAMVAISKGLPLVIIGQGSAGQTTADNDPTGLIVKSDSPLHGGVDFRGKTIGVNALNSLSQLGAMASIDATGGDSSTVKFLEVPVPSMVAAVESGQIDGAVTSEPFVSQAKKQGLRVALYPPTQGLPGTPQLLFVTSRPYLAQHANSIRAFVAGLDKANAELAHDPTEIRSVAAISTKVPADILKVMRLPVFTDRGLELSKLYVLQDAMVKYHVLAQPLKMEQYVLSHTGD